MFLITPEFTVRVDGVCKIFPHREPSRGTYVDVLNNYGSIDREHTALNYNEVIGLLKSAQRAGI